MSRLRTLALLSLALPVALARAEPGPGLVVALAPAAAGGTAVRAERTRFATRLRALGLRPRASLLGPFAGDPASGAEPGAASSGRDLVFSPAAPAPGLEDFDPARVWLIEAADSAAAAAALDSLRDDPGVAWAEPERIRWIAAFPADAPPDDPLFLDGRQWGLRNLGPAGPLGGVAGADIGALEAWTMSVGSNDVRLAIADTGLDPAQPDIAGPMPDGSPRVVDGMNVTGLEAVTAWADSFSHGTLVTGVAAARTNDGVHFDSLGMAGVCGGDGRGNAGCRVVPIKIAPWHSGSATSFAIASAVVHAVEAGARAMNLSFAGDEPSRVERNAMQWGLVRGCVVVAASGNRGARPQYPAAFAGDGLGIQVGATDAWDRRAGWSSFGPDMDLVAPGVDIWSTFMTYPTIAGASYPGYARTGGTSFAAPHVTGTLGLLAAMRPELEDVDFKHVLRESAHDVDVPGVDSATGWGRLDAAAALRAVGPGVGIWHDEVAAQAFRSRGYDTLSVAEGGFGTLGHWTGRHEAERVDATATVALPDSFLGPVRVWPRIGGTSTVRADWTLPYFVPWAEVVEWVRPGTGLPAGARAFTLRGDVYRVVSDCVGCPDDWVPLPPDQARFAFTVIGRVDRPPSVAAATRAAGATLAPGDTATVTWTASDPDTVSAVEIALAQAGRAPVPLARSGAAAGWARVTIPCGVAPGAAALRVTALDERGPRTDRSSADLAVAIAATDCNGGPNATLRASPNPFRDGLRLAGPAREPVRIFDVAGRLRREAALDAAGGWTWDGLDAEGRAVPAGLYFARAGAGGRLIRLVRVR